MLYLLLECAALRLLSIHRTSSSVWSPFLLILALPMQVKWWHWMQALLSSSKGNQRETLQLSGREGVITHVYHGSFKLNVQSTLKQVCLPHLWKDRNPLEGQARYF